MTTAQTNLCKRCYCKFEAPRDMKFCHPCANEYIERLTDGLRHGLLTVAQFEFLMKMVATCLVDAREAFAAFIVGELGMEEAGDLLVRMSRAIAEGQPNG